MHKTETLNALSNFFHPDAQAHGNQIIRHFDESGNFFDASVDQTIALGLNSWKGWSCSGGSSYFYIDYDGEVWNGNCKTHHLGNIFSTFEIRRDWRICPKELCGCGADILAPKARTDSDKLKFDQKYRKQLPIVSRRVPQESSGSLVACKTAYPTNFMVFWDLGRRCNYSCSYCWPGIHIKDHPFHDKKVLFETVERFRANLPQYKLIQFMFGGGEPTLHPHFLELVEFIRSHGHHIVVTTNGSQPAQYYQRLIDIASINLSIHFEFIKPVKMIEKIRAILERKRSNDKSMSLEIKIMVPPGSVTKGVELRKLLLPLQDEYGKHSFTYSFVPIRSIEDSDKLVTYDERDWGIMKDELGVSPI